MNQVTFIGNMAKDVEIRQAGEKTVGSFSIAINDGYGDKKHTSFFNCTAFGKTAENIAKFFPKGDKIALECQARQNTWEKDGQKHSAVEFVVRSFEFVERKKTDADGFMDVPDAIQEELPFM